jgi:hypothetical protein
MFNKKKFMPLRWNIFRLACFVQLLITAYFAFIAFINLFAVSDLYYLFETLAFTIMCCLAILGLNLLGTNYPDKPVTGRQKKIFNWLFLMNFCLIIFIFGLFFAEYREMKALAKLVSQPFFSFSFRFYLTLIAIMVLLFCQFSILYGLYSLRRLLAVNYYESRKFEFEKNTSSQK